MTTPELFTIPFWQTTIARIVHYAALFALGAWGLGAAGSVDAGANLSVPSWGVAIAAGIGALYAFLLAMVGAQIPASPSNPLAALFPKPGQQLEVRVHEQPPTDQLHS